MYTPPHNFGRRGRRGTVTTNVAVLPSECAFGSFLGANQPDRFTSCSDGLWGLCPFVIQTGDIVGRFDFESIQWITDNRRTVP
jgi:hypothetical protein